MAKPEAIGTHLATLNLFREHDGSLWITISGHTYAAVEAFNAWQDENSDTLHDYLELLIISAARDMGTRKAAGLAVDREEPSPT